MAEKQKKTGTLRCPFSLFGAPETIPDSVEISV